MIRKNSLIADAKFATQQNLEISKTGSKVVPARHELLIRSETNGHKYSLANIVKCLEDQDIEVQSVEIKRPSEDEAHDVPWFPRNAADLDYCHHLKEKCEDDPITVDHPGYHDAEYRERRKMIVQMPQNYRNGEEIPNVAYTAKETETWKLVYTTLKPLHENGACTQYINCFRELEKSGLYNAETIPQLEEVSKQLQACSGFRLRPVGGLVSARDFLASLAVKVFQCTQYIRHHLSPMHTPEPDCCHELIGHVPMLCDPGFASFSQEIGILSLGASDEDIERLSSLYWFTVEFGLCRQDGDIKAYGAGILSAYGEFEHALSEKPELCDFDAEKASTQPYQDTDYQPLYFVSSSFEDALSKVRNFADKTIKKPFSARFDSTSGSIEVFRRNNPHDVARAVKDLKGHLDFIRGLVE